MNKKILLIITLCCLLFSMTSCKNKGEIMENYPSLDKNHVYKEIDVFDLEKKINAKDDFYLLMGFPMCPWCQAIIDVIDDVARDNKIKTVYYIDIKDIRDEDFIEGYTEFHNLANSVFKDAIDTEKNRINAPTFVKIVNGEMVAYHLNTVSSHVMNENMVLPPLTDEEKSELKDILNNIINA